MNTLRTGLIIYLALWVLGIGVASAQDADLEKGIDRARVNGKYSQLLAILPVKEDREQYGDFLDQGFRPGGKYRSHENTPRGFWVWVKPNGNTLETNDRQVTIDYLESLGWKREQPRSEKDELEAYAKEKFGVDLDKRKSLKKLKAEVQALEEG